MTRAIDRLIVCGAEGERRPPDGLLVEPGVAAPCIRFAVEEPADDGDGKVLALSSDATRDAGPVTSSAAAARQQQPSWLAQMLQGAVDGACRSRLRALTMKRRHRCVPSRAGSPAERRKAMARGVLMHRLLQSLPDIPREARAEAALRYLARAAGEFSAEEREGLLDRSGAYSKMRGSRSCFCPEAAPRCRSSGRLKDGDPCCLRPDRPPRRHRRCGSDRGLQDQPSGPRPIEEVPPAYVRQLALYRAVLAQLYPDKVIRAALLWTDVPDLMEIPACGAWIANWPAVTSP